MRVFLFINPHARRGRQLGASVRIALMRCGLELVEDSHRMAEVDGIVVAGGDGSFARWIGAALEFGLPMGLVPLGTFNDLARTLGIPFDVDDACAAIAAAGTRTIDVARVNGAYYVNEASIGLSSRVTRLQKERDKQRLGFLAIALSVIGAVRHMRPFHATVAYDGRLEQIKTVQVTVANSNHFGGFVTVAGAAIDDGWLDFYSVEIGSWLEAIPVAAAIAAGKWQGGRAVRTYRAQSFDIGTHRPHRITADGESAGKTPARFEILRKALRVFAPAPYARM